MSITATPKRTLGQAISEFIGSMTIEAVENAREQICECLVTATDGPGGSFFEWDDLEELTMNELFRLYAGTYGHSALRVDIVDEYKLQYPAK